MLIKPRWSVSNIYSIYCQVTKGICDWCGSVYTFLCCGTLYLFCVHWTILFPSCSLPLSTLFFIHRKNEVKRRWEQDRTALGSKWAWLCHQVTSINQQIRHLNSHLQSCPPKDPVSLTSSTLLTTLPCVCQHKLNSNGITPSLPKNSAGPSSLMKPTTNGVCSPCPCQLRQMLLANTSGSTPQIRVQELLGCNFPVLLMEESTQTCARTRSLQHPPSQRKLIRTNKKKRRTGRGLDECHHPQLSHLGGVYLCLCMVHECVLECVVTC